MFPPNAGIGGRRWAKFAKYLAEQGYIIHVITAQQTNSQLSEWATDAIHTNINNYFLPTKYPSILEKTPTTLFEKLEYRFWMLFFKWYSKGTLFDRSVFWKKQLVKKASELITEYNIKNVIVTIPPYKLAHHCIALKHTHKNINLIVDYRDPWADNKSFHGFKNLSSNRLQHEVKIENEVLCAADKIITVADNMTQKLVNRNITDASKFLTIQNGFDESDILLQCEDQPSTDKIKFIYAGSLYSNLNYVITPLLQELQQLKRNNKELYNRFEFSFYGNQDEQLKQLIKEADLDVITVYGQIPLKQVYQNIQRSHFCLLFSAPDHAFSFNTKFFEYLACRKPILLFSNIGETSRFIKDNTLGFVITPTNFKQSFTDFLYHVIDKKFDFNTSFDLAPYSVKTKLKDLEQILV